MKIDQNILKNLQDIRDRALATYSKFRVGAIIVTEHGKQYSGHNIETSSYGLTICAERVALFKALSEGERQFKKIYIIADNDEFCPPCGACRQVLMDYAPEIKVILVNQGGQTKEYKLSELLPNAFTDDRLLRKKG